MTKKLKNLRLTRVDRVDKGSNPGSKIVLFKSDAETAHELAKATFDDLMNQATGAVMAGVNDLAYVEHVTEDNVAIYRDYAGVRMAISLARDGDTFETDGDPYAVMMDFRPVNNSSSPEVEKGASTVAINKEDLTEEQVAALEEIEKERDDAVAKAEADAARIAELEEAVPADDAGPEVDVLKGLSDEAREVVQKAQADAAEAQERIAKMEDAADTARFIGIAKSDLNHDGDTATSVGGVLKSVAKTHGEDSDEYKTLLQTLKAAAAQSEHAIDEMSKNLGASGAESSAAPGQIRDMAKAYAFEHGVSEFEAMSIVRKQNSGLMAEYEDERASRVRDQNGA